MTGGSRLKGRSPLGGSNLLDEFEKDRVKESVDIVDLISSSGVSLVQKGASWMGRCPFHEDKSPSLSVNREKGLFNCFGCGAGGDVFDFVMKSKGVDFKEALGILKGSPLKSLKVSALPVSSKTPSVESLRSVSLQHITAYYQKHLTDPKATAYLKKRGIYAPELLFRLHIGFSLGDLSSKVSVKQKEELKQIGLFNEKEFESFAGCITFPLFDSSGQVVGLYGRATSGRKLKHLYLKGPHRGLFNHKAFKVYPERMILTESIIDALSLMVLGLENVSCIYGTQGVTSHLLEMLKDSRTKEVVLAFDNDDPGRQAALTHAESFLKKGFAVRTIFPQSKDWNQALPDLKKQDVLDLIEEVPLQSAESIKGLIISENGIYTYTDSTLTYRIIGVKEGAISSMKVNMRCQKGDDENVKFIDNVDLFSARSRVLFSSSAGRKFTVDSAVIEKDLLGILDALEELTSQSLSPAAGERIMSQAEQTLGMKLLCDPELFDRIVQDTETLGYVGEDENKILMYLAASSRLMVDPVSVIVISQSAAGKSYLIDTVKKLMPEEDVISMTSLSDQALNYLPDEALLHKFLVMGEAVHSDAVDHQMREMLSGKELSRLVTTKDEKTGKMASRLVHKKVIVSAVMSSTSTEINPENASRCFVINTDESQDQTRAIHRRQRQKYSLESYRRKEELIPQLIQQHQAAQRLLTSRLIINPFAGQLDFPSTLMRSRRDHERFVDLIACVCFLRQYQKTEKNEAGKRFIECDLEDYKVAYRIMKGLLSSTMTNVPRSAVLLYEELRTLIRDKAKKDGLFLTDLWVTQREIREVSGFSHELIKKNMRLLVEYEFIRCKGSGRGMTRRYGLAADTDLVLFDESVIPSPQQLGKAGTKRGQNDGKA